MATYESLTNQILVEVKVARVKTWRVDVSKTDSNWHTDFTLSVQRTGNGTGAGSISGGTSYQEVTSTDIEFFSGDKNRKDIPVQLRLSGMSVDVAPDTYTTTVYYTVLEN